MWNQVSIRSLLLFLVIVCVAVTLQTPKNTGQRSPNEEQWADTKNTFNNISRTVNELIVDEREARVMKTTTPSSDINATTTAAPFRLTRRELNRIVRRNLLGLVRLYNLELKDALGQSNRVNADFKRNASIEVSKYL